MPTQTRPLLQIHVGSIRPTRIGPAFATWFAALAEKHAAFEVEVIDLAEVGLTRTGAGLRVLVRDEGRGGAEEISPAPGSRTRAGGSGLPGMRRRVAALDGTFNVTSPTGGPTVIEAELPCVW